MEKVSPRPVEGLGRQEGPHIGTPCISRRGRCRAGGRSRLSVKECQAGLGCSQPGFCMRRAPRGAHMQQARGQWRRGRRGCTGSGNAMVARVWPVAVHGQDAVRWRHRRLEISGPSIVDAIFGVQLDLPVTEIEVHFDRITKIAVQLELRGWCLTKHGSSTCGFIEYQFLHVGRSPTGGRFQ